MATKDLKINIVKFESFVYFSPSQVFFVFWHRTQDSIPLMRSPCANRFFFLSINGEFFKLKSHQSLNESSGIKLGSRMKHSHWVFAISYGNQRPNCVLKTLLVMRFTRGLKLLSGFEPLLKPK